MTAKEFLISENYGNSQDYERLLVAFARLKVKEALLEVSKKLQKTVNNDSLLKSYKLDNIK